MKTGVRVQMEYVGFVAKLTGRKEELIVLEEDFDLQALLRMVLNRRQPLAEVRSSLIVALNKKIVQPEGASHTLVDGDRVSVGLKISGG